LFYSLKQHNPSFNLPYYIFTWGELSEANIAKLNKMYDKFIIKNINNKNYEGVEYSTKWRNWNINCINRFEIFTLREYDKLVFLDADMQLIINDFDKNILSRGFCQIYNENIHFIKELHYTNNITSKKNIKENNNNNLKYIINHVRIPFDKKVTSIIKNNIHPFIYKNRYLCMHNGQIKFKKIKRNY
jgi:hypothetical protein